MKKAKRSFQFLGVLLAVLLFVGTSAFAGLNDELIEAAENGNANEVKTLLAKSTDVNAKDKGGKNTLNYAQENGYKKIVKFLKQKMSITWDKTFGGSVLDTARSISPAPDGGYIVAGGTESKGAGKNDAWIIKLDKNGNIKMMQKK